MTGRSRGASTSSVETVDQDQIPWRQETSVLRSVPKQSDSNSWPIFELRDTIVLNKDGHSLENALHVGDTGPLIIRGTLIIDDPSQKQHLIMKVRNSIPIEIRQSNSYSIGEAEDGQPLIWVAGKGGWYEIVPAPSYVPIYNKMCEAATLYYRIMDVYKSEKPKKSKKGKRLDHMIELSSIFHKYAARVGDGSTLDEVVERCLEHAPFLLSQSLQEDLDEFDWRPTPFFNWLKNKSPDVYEKIIERAKNPVPLPASPSAEPAPPTTQTLPSRTRTRAAAVSPSVATPRQNSPRVESKSNAPKQRSAKSQPAMEPEPEATVELDKAQPTSSVATVDEHVASNATPPPPQGSTTTLPLYDEKHTPFESVLHALEYAYQQLEKSRKGLTTLSTLNKIYFIYKFPNWRIGPPGCHKIPVEEVLQYNATELLKVIDKEKYSKHEIYSWLQDAATKEFNPVSIKPSEFPFRLVPRGSRPRVANNTDASGTTQSNGLATRNAGVPSPAGKAPRGRKAGKKGGLRLATGSKKRQHSELESESEPDEVELKKSHFFNEDDNMVLDDEADGSAEDESSSSQSEQDPIRIVIRADKIPSAVPQGPSETWTCEEEDCGYVVRGGDAQDCQDRIKQHFEHHEEQASMVNLAMTESRGHLPINHLIEKLKNMAGKSQDQTQIIANGTMISVEDSILPKPIKRNLHV